MFNSSMFKSLRFPASTATRSTLRCLCILAFLTPGISLAADAPVEAKKPDKLYELRLYTANAGKLPELHARFRDHTLKLFEKHGMENIIYWTVSEGAAGDDTNNMLVYIIAHKDKAAADASWAAFRADPDWQAAQAKSEVNGKLLAKDPVSVFMIPTEFSPPQEPVTAKPDPSTPGAAPAPARLFELRKYNTGAAGLPATVDRFRAGEAALFPKNGMATLNFWTAADNSSFIYLLAHKDRETSRTAWTAFFNDFRQFQTEYNARGGAAGGRATPTPTALTAPAAPGAPAAPAARGAGRGGRGAGGGGGSEIRFLVPTDYSPRK